MFIFKAVLRDRLLWFPVKGLCFSKSQNKDLPCLQFGCFVVLCGHLIQFSLHNTAWHWMPLLPDETLETDLLAFPSTLAAEDDNDICGLQGL